MKTATAFILFALLNIGLAAEDQIVNGKKFTVPAGCVIELVARSPLVDRPISCDFDEQGRLYVTDSSGSNENVNQQLKKKPHRIVRLEDTDSDGLFDKSIVFADRMMFPEGAMWHDGSLYVCAPPQIWKLTDTDGDGKADRREVWFDGKTLTGCANDLHGPYLGPDGWIYWCKGAFAEQTYDRKDEPDFKTRAAHIFRRRPAGGPIEHVMTGGMDNPVELVFTPEGERIFNTTFLHHPHDGKRDGLIHAIYGGIYGKDHGVLEGHPRTGALMPVLANHDASAPSGLARLETGHFGKSYQNNVLCSSFNMHKIFRHRLSYSGSMLQTRNEDFVLCHDLDFHPTDVIEDADGSILIVDTGGWYKLCCPTSQLQKPDILGGIYRVRKKNAPGPKDPRGLQIPWATTDPVNLIDDPRPAVRRVAKQLAVKKNLDEELAGVLADEKTSEFKRLMAVWTLSGMQSNLARRASRQAILDQSPQVRQAAAHVVSAWKDQDALDPLCALLKENSSMNRRVAAEALGRLKNPLAIPSILQAAGELPVDQQNPGHVTDRALEHSLIYALIEIGNAKRTAEGLKSNRVMTQHVALMALSQMKDTRLNRDTVLAWIDSEQEILRSTAWWMVQKNLAWVDGLVPYFRTQFQARKFSHAELSPFTGHPSIQGEILKILDPGPPDQTDSEAYRELQVNLVELLSQTAPKNLSPAWKQVPRKLLSTGDPRLAGATIQWIKKSAGVFGKGAFDEGLKRIASNPENPAPLRLSAYAASRSLGLRDPEVAFLCENLATRHSVARRSIAVEALQQADLAESQSHLLADCLSETGPAELETLIDVLLKNGSDRLGLVLLVALEKSNVATSLDPEKLAGTFTAFGPKTVERSQGLLEKIKRKNVDKSARLEKVLSLVATADPRRGQSLFHGNKASCIACHQMGYLGGRIGPSLSNIGRIRSERDLLESLMYPSVSFVRSFEPVVIETVDGRIISGIVKNETSTLIEITIDAQKTERLEKSKIENRKIGKMSIMPSGLDKQFSDHELADLIKFLKVSK